MGGGERKTLEEKRQYARAYYAAHREERNAAIIALAADSAPHLHSKRPARREAGTLAQRRRPELDRPTPSAPAFAKIIAG
ncbi:MAG TPA: hypothetical protein VHE13_03960 [Opitutus sp.]|nr:hypothetical protein [Opitutus sp.]